VTVFYCRPDFSSQRVIARKKNGGHVVVYYQGRRHSPADLHGWRSDTRGIEGIGISRHRPGVGVEINLEISFADLV
jgi:hypothetical protein